MKIDYSYLSPPKQAFKIKKLKQEQFQVIDQKPYRKIFQKVKYNDQENKKIDRVKQYLKQRQPNKIYNDSFILKMTYLTSGVFNPLSVCQNIKKHYEWFQSPSISNYRDQGRKILQEGIFYAYGRDLEYSPLIYFYPSQIDTNKYSVNDYYNALYMLFQPIEQHMLIPGIIQSFNIIIDMQNKSFPLSIGTLRQMIEKIVFAYPYRLKRLIFINTISANQLVKCMKQTLKNFNYQIKPQIISNTDQFRKYISDQQREKKYGGNLENLNQFWPISLATKFQEEKSYFIIQNTSETDYKTVINQEVFFQANQPQNPGCGSCCAQKTCQIY